VISELATACRIEPLRRRHPATLVAIATALILALVKGGGKGGMILWPLFGTTNQLLAGLALLVLTLYLAKQGKPVLYTMLPMLFVVTMTGWAMVLNFKNFITDGNVLLAIIGGIVILLEIWIIVEVFRAFSTHRRIQAPVPAPDV
jgi:carbon starvation protein